ncbi:lipoprotein [Streptomyces sp. OM5714]|nr:lipoprotein [Streptomyces sp. OM5714]
MAESATVDVSGSPSGKSTGGRTIERCHTSALRASVGPNHPGAGHANFSVVFTNSSRHTCTLRGYPGTAFADSDGKQVGSNPKRTPGSPTTVTLEPGEEAWAGLSYANPEIGGATTVRPASLLVTPPDERDSLTLRWTGGEIPVSGNAATASVSVLQPGTGA